MRLGATLEPPAQGECLGYRGHIDVWQHSSNQTRIRRPPVAIRGTSDSVHRSGRGVLTKLYIYNKTKITTTDKESDTVNTQTEDKIII